MRAARCCPAGGDWDRGLVRSRRPRPRGARAGRERRRRSPDLAATDGPPRDGEPDRHRPHAPGAWVASLAERRNIHPIREGIDANQQVALLSAAVTLGFTWAGATPRT